MAPEADQIAAEKRHVNLERLRVLWTDAVERVRVTIPRTIEWNEARLIERHAGAEFVRRLREWHDRPAEPSLDHAHLCLVPDANA